MRASALVGSAADNALSIYLECFLVMGKTDEALASYREALAIDEALVAADPTSAEARRDLAVTYSDLGDVYPKMATAETPSGNESLSRYREARTWYRRCLHLLTAMQDEGVLAASDANWLEATAAQVAKCDVAIERLERC